MSGTSFMMEFTWLKRKMKNPSPRSHVQNHPKRGSNPWVFLTPKLYQSTFGKGDSGYPTTKGVHTRSYLLRSFIRKKCSTPENERLGAPEKSHQGDRKIIFQPNPPLLSSMLIFQDVWTALLEAWVDSIEANSKVNEARFSICLPVFFGFCVAIEKSWFSQKPKKINKNCIINLYVETSSFCWKP